MDDRALIQTLCSSFEKQQAWYSELTKLVQASLSKMVLSRGDMAGVMDTMARKQRIIEEIGNERERMKDLVGAWNQRKTELESVPEGKELDRILAQTQKTIQAYLAGENQLKKYLEHLMEKGQTGDR